MFSSQGNKKSQSSQDNSQNYSKNTQNELFTPDLFLLPNTLTEQNTSKEHNISNTSDNFHGEDSNGSSIYISSIYISSSISRTLISEFTSRTDSLRTTSVMTNTTNIHVQEVTKYDHSSEKTASQDSHLYQFEHKFSKSLFLNEDERKRFNINYLSMNQALKYRQLQYDIDYYNYFNEKKKWIDTQLEIGLKHLSNETKELRANIRILIIIGSQLKYSQKDDKNKFLSGYEDLSTALFLRNIFHYCYGLNYSQIIITSIKENDFSYDKNVSLKKSYDPVPQFLNEKTEGLEKQEKIGKFKNDLALRKTYNKLIYTQVGKQDMVFITDESLDSIILPFNKQTLSLLKTNVNSELIVFFLDHGLNQSMDDANYECFLEQFHEMNFSHATIINDACFSGRFVELFKSCEIFEHLIHLPFYYNGSKANDSKMESYITIHDIIEEFSSEEQRHIYIILYNIFLRYNIYHSIKSISEQKSASQIEKLPYDIGLILSQFENIKADINNICESIILDVINNQIFHQKDEKQIQFNTAFKEFTRIFEKHSKIDILIIDTQIVNTLKNRITILSSCNYNEEAFSLPLRKNLYFPYKHIQIYGTIYMSAVIKCLLHPSKFEDFTSKGFISGINTEFQNLKKDFYQVIKEQNSQKDPTPDDKAKMENIKRFFKDGNIPPSYIKFNDMIPFNKLILPEKFWFFDTETVNEQEYEGLKNKNYK